MTIRSREEAAKAAEATRSNVPGTCQLVTRGYYNAASAGDFDGDGAADAEDGWKKEPAWAKHIGDRNPPRGAPVSFLGGRDDNGHRAISLSDEHDIIRSTDFDGVTKRYRAGSVGNGTIDEVARAMGVTYAGYSDTIDGEPIPGLPVKPKSNHPKHEKTRGENVDNAIESVEAAKAKPGSEREKLLERAARLLNKIKAFNKK